MNWIKKKLMLKKIHEKPFIIIIKPNIFKIYFFYELMMCFVLLLLFKSFYEFYI